ncbi:hypothetical protein KR026_001911 [Drosophila bipectinata]|nr:hypothetical protein KR026_001911 [Drosophila bipectinata]
MFVPNFKLVGRERLLNGTVEYPKDLDNEYQVSVELSSDATGAGYKQLPLEVPPMPFCTALRSFYQRFMKKSIVTGINTDVDFKNGKLCPFPKGMHFLKNVYFDTSEWAVIMPRGLLKMRLNIWDKDEFAGGFEYILEIKDKTI